MAALRVFARAAILSSGRLLNHAATRSRTIAPVVVQTQYRWSSYRSSPMYTKPEDYTDYEISKDPNEWKYVERLLPYKTIPEAPTEDVNFPSGWKPQRASPTDYPYFIPRTRNHMLPVYLSITYRGTKKVTIVSKIEGDIWALERDLKTHIKDCKSRHICPTQLHEFAGKIKFKGDHVSCIKEWMEMKGF